MNLISLIVIAVGIFIVINGLVIAFAFASEDNNFSSSDFFIAGLLASILFVLIMIYDKL